MQGCNRDEYSTSEALKCVDRLSHDLREVSPDMREFSSFNLKYMRVSVATRTERESCKRCLHNHLYHAIALRRLATRAFGSLSPTDPQ